MSIVGEMEFSASKMEFNLNGCAMNGSAEHLTRPEFRIHCNHERKVMQLQHVLFVDFEDLSMNFNMFIANGIRRNSTLFSRYQW